MVDKVENIYLFVPNIIGYVRILLAILSFALINNYYATTITLYVISGLLDAVDGFAARSLKQATRFGSMLDMLTDRCVTMCLISFLSHIYPRYMFLFHMVMVIDISCHWLHQYTAALMGHASHKSAACTPHPILRLYYTSRLLLFTLCAGSELFYALLYLLHFCDGPKVYGIEIYHAIVWLCAPVAVIKIAISLLQGYVAASQLASVDVKERKN